MGAKDGEETMELKTKRLNENATLPTRGTEGAAGLDLYCNETIYMKSGVVYRVPTGLALEIPHGHYGLITGRSSTALKNILVFPTVCDADYRGEIFITARFDGDGSWRISKGDRIAQIVITPFAKATQVEADELSETDRGTGGYGSTGD